MGVLQKLTTISHHIDNERKYHPTASGEFTAILNDLTLAIRLISKDVRRAGLNDILGLANSTNIHGEDVKRLDVIANEVIKKVMAKGGHICIMGSEEEDEIVILPRTSERRSKYVLVFDPLDGSSNIDVNVTIGTIFSLYKRVDPKSEDDPTIEDVLQPGYKQCAAGYALYGSSTMLVYTTGHGVQAFTYDPTVGEFLLTQENVRIPNKGKVYSINEGNYYKWDENLKQYIDYLKMPSIDKSRPYSARYIGSAVADLHRTLLNGGIYIYPKDDSMANGKLRLVYEANALSMIIEQAGGRATDGENRILELKPSELHQRTPLIIGSKEDVFEAEMFLKGEHPMQKMVL